MKMRLLPFMVLSTIVAGCHQGAKNPVADPPVATQAIGVTSTPLGAKVYVDGIEKGTTPTTVVLEKNRDHLISIVKDGYKPVFTPVNHRIDDGQISLVALRSGINGLDSAINVYEVNERTGQYNNLFPTNVTATLELPPQNEQEPLALQ